MNRTARRAGWALCAVLAVSCGRKASGPAPARMKEMAAKNKKGGGKHGATGATASSGLGGFGKALDESAESEVAMGFRGAPGAPPPPKSAPAAAAPRGGDNDADGMPDSADALEGAAQAEAPAREWFPESFLFRPLVVTDAQGKASVDARVPDRLTSWRVLALAHSRAGMQAGTVTSFLGTLPAYVEPVVPPFLVAGDTVRLPIQVVNTTDKPLKEELKLTAAGAGLGAVGGQVEVPASGNHVQYVELRAPKPGQVKLQAAFGDTDAVVRTFPVRPNGKPVDVSQGGTLAAPRTLHLEAPKNAEPDSGRVRLAVFPGALALLRAELTAASSREGSAADAYALLLSGKGPELLAALGEKPDVDTLRTMTLVSSQRAFAAARAPALPVAVLFAQAALSHPESPVLVRLGERLAAQVAAAQRPDGTFSGENGWTLQRLLVATADALSAVRAGATTTAGKQRAQGAGVRAAGAFERNVKLVSDGYTAAAILASGGVEGSVAEALRTQLRAAIQKTPDGARYLPIGEGTVRADGTVPPDVEATALAALALEKDEQAPWRADLGAYLLSRYEPEWGWGDGQTNLSCLRAVLALFKDPLPAKVHVTLEVDGKLLTEGTLEGARLKDVLALEAPIPHAAGSHAWVVRAEPALPGLGYALSLRTYVPWEQSPSGGGFELTLAASAHLKVGMPADVDLRAVSPVGVAASVRQSLPAGVQADKASLEKLKADGVIDSYTTPDGEVTLELRARNDAEPVQARYRVIPTLAGTLHAAASTISPSQHPELAYELPPVTWTVQ
jgi:hypothetical protein